MMAPYPVVIVTVPKVALAVSLGKPVAVIFTLALMAVFPQVSKSTILTLTVPALSLLTTCPAMVLVSVVLALNVMAVMVLKLVNGKVLMFTLPAKVLVAISLAVSLMVLVLITVSMLVK
jgi:hypothetical protein